MRATIAARRGVDRQTRAAVPGHVRRGTAHDATQRGASAGVPVYLRAQSPANEAIGSVGHTDSGAAPRIQRASASLPGTATAPSLPVVHTGFARRISDPGDAQEQEADQFAERILRMPPAREAGDFAPMPSGASSGVSRGAAVAAPAALPAIVHDTLHSAGQPLDGGARAFFEPRFGVSLGQVRVHTDAHSAASARAISAVAYTAGRDIVFDSNRYQPYSAAGRQLLGHELTHVLQQAQGQAGADARFASRPQYFNDAAPDAGRADGHSRAGDLPEAGNAAGSPLIQRLYAGPPEGGEIKGKKFSAEEMQWIGDVWNLPEIELLFHAYGDVPDPVLHRVTSLDGAEGVTSGDNLSIADRTYETRETYVNAAGASVKATREQAFKGTLLHELLHFFFNQTEHLKKTFIPKTLQSIMIYPERVGMEKAAFGWFQHPKSGLVLHLDMDQTKSVSWEQAYVEPESDLRKIQDSGAYEHSPMPQSGESISPEEDLAAVMALYLTSEESRNTLKVQFPKRFDLIAGYFGNVLPNMIKG